MINCLIVNKKISMNNDFFLIFNFVNDKPNKDLYRFSSMIE